jgi:hypothetical protein
MMNFKLPFNWFDVALVVLLVCGVSVGRKRGLSVELLSALMWLAIVIGCSAAYAPVAGIITTSSNLFSAFSANLAAYFGALLVIVAVFTFIKKSLGGKLVGSDAFGRGEFYLGMMAGMVKFACMIVVGLAFLHARYYTAAEIKADQKYQNDVYGSDFFPSLYEVQAQVFDKSLTGPWIKKELDWLLIKPAVPEQKQLARKQFDLP